MVSPQSLSIRPNTEAFEREVLIASSGFREYDARWLYPEQINLRGFTRLGLALGNLIRQNGVTPKIVVGHDYRSYSATLKNALIIGLMQAGCDVHDIGLCLSPTAYFAQFHLDAMCVAMVTASHNENGWTGVKMGLDRPKTFSPDLMLRLRELALGNAELPVHAGGAYTYHDDVRAAYLADLAKGGKIARGLKAVVACGNGTAGAYAPEVLRAIGVEVVEMECDLDYTFPNHNPNPEDLAMLHALGEQVRATGADLGLAFDGDGDRCGVVDHRGEEIFADKIGVLLARDFARDYPGARFIVDVKSTSLYATDPELQAAGAVTEYWKTGHSYLKSRLNETGAMAAFEKSGHYFFAEPLGRGYDDGLASAIAVCRMLDHAVGQSLAEVYASLAITWSSPTMSPYCPDDRKYAIVESVTKKMSDMAARGALILAQKIENVVTVNGVRVTLADGTWGLVRASSNKPSLVVVVESPVSQAQMTGMFNFIDDILKAYPEIGEYDQKLKAA